jgi:PDZ domain-containing protein
VDPTAPSVPSGDESVADDDQPTGPSRRLIRIWATVAAVVGVLVALTVAAALIKVPYILLSPGSARATEPLIMVEGAPTFPHEGAVEFTTVSLRKASALEAVMGWLDPTVEVVEEELVLGGRTPDENREANLQEMLDSKEVATAVALEELGYDVVHGTGAVVNGIVEGSPAEAILETGDVIVEAEGQPIELSSDLGAVTRAMAPGEVLDLRVEPADGATAEDVSAALAASPADASRGLLGVTTSTRDLSFDFPFEVIIDSGSVGGPSAGLAFTLGILETLTPESLTGGQVVATTGTIDPNGFVGPVGGVEQKTVAVRRSGADLFLVPSSELELARKFAGDMRVEPVDTIDDALAVLSTLGGGSDVLAQASPNTTGG